MPVRYGNVCMMSNKSVLRIDRHGRGYNVAVISLAARSRAMRPPPMRSDPCGTAVTELDG